MFLRKNRLIQVFITLMLVTIILPILFTVFINRANQTGPSTTNPALDPFPIYSSKRQTFEKLAARLDATSNGSKVNLSSLMLVQQNYLRSMAGSSERVQEEQIAFAFADLTNRLQYAESYATDRRQEINQLMKEIRYLWSLIQKQKSAPAGAVSQVGARTNSSATIGSPSMAIPKDTEEPNDAAVSMAFNELLHLPSIFSVIPFVHQTADSSLNPSFRIAPKKTRRVRFVFGIPTVKRTVESYLLTTLQNLIVNLTPAEKYQACFVVLIAETDPDFIQQTASQISSQFPREVRSGLIEVISPPAAFYPNMSTLKQTLGDKMERVQWRSKQNLDFAYLMMYCKSKGVYYVQLEDDIITKPLYLTEMQNFATTSTLKTPDWLILDFCSLGFIGKMFKSSDLSKLILFFATFYNDKPVDWLLDNYVDTKICNHDVSRKVCKKQKDLIWILHKPALFQHVGTHSSLKGKVQKLRDKTFGKVKLFLTHSDNPAAKLHTTVKEYKNYRLSDAYWGHNFFWAFSPVKDDLIVFHFDKPVSLERCLVRSGNPEHPGDILQNATFQIRSSANGLNGNYNITNDGYIDFGTIVDGFVNVFIPEELNPIEEARIKYYDNSSHWVILSEIYMKLVNSADASTTTTDRPNDDQ